MKKVLFTNCTFNAEKIKELEKYDLEIVKAKKDLTDEELIEALQDCDAVISNGDEYFSEDILKKCEKLKVIQFFGIGYQKCIDANVAKKYNKVVMNTPKVNSYSVAEFTLGLIFALNQKLLMHDNDTRNGRWEERTFFDLKNKTIGVIGMGHIGISFSKMLYNAFDANIIYYDKERKLDVEKELNAKYVSLEELMKESDIVSLRLPLTDQTKGLLGKKELSLMKESAYFINTARAEIVDAKSLYELINTDKIAGAAFDGFYNEPVDYSSDEAKLLSLPVGKFILTPHTGYNAVEGMSRVEDMCIDNLIKFFNAEECKSIVN